MRGCFLTMGLLVLLCGCGGRRQSVEGLTAADIASIEVYFGNLPDDRPDVGPFQVAPQDFERLLGLLRGGKHASSRGLPGCQWLADLRIRIRGGEEVRAYLYQARVPPSLYRVDRTYYWGGGSDQEIIRALSDCQEHAQAKGRAEQSVTPDRPRE